MTHCQRVMRVSSGVRFYQTHSLDLPGSMEFATLHCQDTSAMNSLWGPKCLGLLVQQADIQPNTSSSVAGFSLQSDQQHETQMLGLRHVLLDRFTTNKPMLINQKAKYIGDGSRWFATGYFSQ